MGLPVISTNYFRAVQIPSIVSAIKIGTFAFALTAIQGLGVLAQTYDQAASNVEEADYWQNQYASRVNKLTEANKKTGTEWIFPTTQEEWGHLAELNSARWSDIVICSGLHIVNSALKKPWQSDTLTKAQEAFCKRAKAYFTHYATLQNCGPHSADLMRCINSDPENRKATLESLAASIETILPQNAEESQHIPIKDCYSTKCAAIGKMGQPKEAAQASNTQKNTKPIPTQDCYSFENCPDIDKNNVHEREIRAADAAYTTKELKTKREQLQSWLASNFIPPEWIDVQEVLRFRSDDPREKFLFIIADYDHNGAFDASNIANMLSQLSQKFDLKIQLVKETKDICLSVQSGEKTGNLVHVLLAAHGNPALMVFDMGIDANGNEYLKDGIWESDSTYLSNCFSGLQPNGKILLMSCSTGGMKNTGTQKQPRENGLPFENIAQKMANAAKRIVVAPRDLAHPGLSNFLSDNGVLYESVKESKTGFYSYLPFYTNLYSSFRPIFKNCFPEIDMMKIHQRELAAIDIIKTDLISKSLVHKDEPPDRANEYLQICSDDPRKKVLFFVADYDDNGAMKPKLTPSILGLFADRFDLKYRVVKAPSEICQDIDLVAKTGSIANVVVLSHGTATEGMILSKDSKGNEIRLKDSLSCFSKIEKDGTIFLMGSSLGQKSDDKNNIAQKIANASKRTVIAGTCLIRPAYTKIKSLDPLMMEHPQYGMWDNFFHIGCPENNENLYKTFIPK